MFFVVPSRVTKSRGKRPELFLVRKKEMNKVKTFFPLLLALFLEETSLRLKHITVGLRTSKKEAKK